MNLSKKKTVISLICAVAYFVLFLLGRLWNISLPSAVPIVLCSLLCGFPWGPLAAFASLLITEVFFGYQLAPVVVWAFIAFLTGLIPALMSVSAGTNLSSAAPLSAAKVWIAALLQAIASYVGNVFFLWFFFVRNHDASMRFLPTAEQLIQTVVSVLLTVVLALMLGRRKSVPTPKESRSADDDR